jgi:hypothetical protein
MQQFGSFSKQVVSNVRTSQNDPWICRVSFPGVPREREHFCGHLHLTEIGMFSNIDKSASIQVAALQIHPGIRARRILAQNMIGEN